MKLELPQSYCSTVLSYLPPITLFLMLLVQAQCNDFFRAICSINACQLCSETDDSVIRVYVGCNSV
jgi:hypothetical protein